MPTCVGEQETLAETEMEDAEIALSPEADLAATQTREKVLLNLLVQSGSAKSHIEMFGKTSILRRL